MFSTAIALVDTKYGPESGFAILRASSAFSSPRGESHVLVVMPLKAAPAPSSARTICELVSVSNSSPGATSIRIAN